MKRTNSPFYARRTFILTLLSFVAVAAVVTFGVSARRANREAALRATNNKAASAPAGKALDQDPNSPQAAVIVATLTDNITAATKVAPGANINYTATITNNGAASPADDATNLNYSGPLDANTTLVPGSVHASPIAFNNTYNWIGNTVLDTSARALPTVTANDVAVNPPGGTDIFNVTTIAGGATTLGGSVTLAANGHYTYTPPLNRPNAIDGASVNDSFTYTISNSADPTLTSTGTVTITLTGRVFYLLAGAAGDGRSGTPSGNPATMSTNADKSTDIFYMFSNAGSLSGLFTVDAGQQLLGQGINLVVNIPTLGSVTLFNSAAPIPTTTNGAGNCVTLAGAPGNNTLSGFNIGTCSAFGIQGANVGTLAVSTLSINNTTGGGLDLTGVGAPTVSVVLGSLTSTGGTNNVRLVGLNGTVTLASGALSASTAGATNHAFAVSGGGTAAITYSGSITKANQGNVVNISGRTGGTITLSGTINGSGSNGINVSSNTGGIVDFTGGTKTLNTAANAGVTLATNTGAAINFSGGGLDIDTTSGTGFSATGGGTVTVTTGGNPNTIDSTAGPALTITSTTIGASGITFRSITSVGGTAPGINLSATGNTGIFTVTGNAGSCTSAGTCTGGSITGKTGASETTGTPGVRLNNVANVRLSFMNIGSNNHSGIYGTTVNGFQLTSCNITNNGDSNVSNPDEIGVDLQGLTGTAIAGANPTSITNSNIQNNFEKEAAVTNTAGTLTDLQMSGNTMSTTNASGVHGDVFQFVGQSTSTMTLNLTSGTFTGTAVPGCSPCTADGIFANAGGTNMTVNVSGATFTNNNVGINVGTDPVNTTLTFNLHDNNITASRAIGINSFHNGNPPFARTINGRIQNNTIGTLGVAQSGSSNGRGIDIGNEGAVPMTLLISGNTIQEVGVATISGAEGIAVNVGLTGLTTGGALTSVTISGNTIRDIRNSRGLIVDDNQNTPNSPAPTICANVTGNTFAGVIAGQAGNLQRMRFDQDNGIVRVPQADAAAIAASNTGVTAAQTSIGGTITFSQPVCATPPIPNPSDETANNRTDEGLNSNLSTIVLAQAGAEAGNSTAPQIAPVTANVAPKSTGYRATMGNVMHHAIRTMASVANKLDSIITPTAYAQDSAPNAPTSGENVTLNTIATFPAGGKSITIKYSATVNTPPLARQVSTQGTVTANAGAISVLTDDPEPAGAANPTVTLVDTLLTWNGVTDTNWNVATNWTPPAGGTQYAPGVSNPAINDVVIPNVGNQPNIGTTDIGIFSLNLSNGRTLTIDAARTLTIGGAPGGDLTLDGIISGGNLNLGTGNHVINNAGGTGSLSSTNVATVLSGSTVALNNNLQAGALAVNAGGNMNITSRTLSLNGSGAALVIPGGATFTTTGSTIVFNGTAAQQAAGIAYNNLTINNSIGLNVTGVTLQGNATINGALALTSSDLSTGAFTLTHPNTTLTTGVSDVIGTVTRSSVVAATPLTFGHPDNRITITVPGTLPTSLTMVIAKAAPATYPTAVSRNYNITHLGGSGFTATLRLHYLDTELNGNAETPTVNFNLRKGPGWGAVVPTARDTAGASNWLENSAVTSFSQWTFSFLAPTASGGAVTGRIVDDNGVPVEGAVVRLSGAQNRKFITDANGFYRFDNVETNGFYNVTPSRVNYTFSPSVISFSQIGETTNATFGATATGASVNPLDTPEYFVRQHYLDFLGREPDEAGFNFWSDQIIGCGDDADCVDRRLQNVSAAYFLSIEFQETGGLVDGLYRASYGRRPSYGEFKPDAAAVAPGLVVGNDGWLGALESGKAAFVNAFVQRPAFQTLYGNLSNDAYVDALIANTGVSFTSAERSELVSGLGGGMTRAAVLRTIVENGQFVAAKRNEAFVMMEYFGYLRREPDADGYQFWLHKLNEFNGNFEQAEMVKSFIISGEYRGRFPR